MCIHVYTALLNQAERRRRCVYSRVYRSAESGREEEVCVFTCTPLC